MKGNYTNDEGRLNENLSGIIAHPREVIDLRELFVLLTYQCNGDCEFCIEKRIHEKGFLSNENFEKALAFAKEKGLTTIFLHGGEPSIHPNVVEFAQKAKAAVFLVKMFTNGIARRRIEKLDGILDELIISYRGDYSLMYKQAEWKTPLTLQVIVTESEFPTLESLITFLREAQKTGMRVRTQTLNPVNQYSYDNQYVPYLEEMFMQLPEEQIICGSNKVVFRVEGIGVRMANKSLNPSHLKYSMTPYGEIQSNFERHFEEIKKNDKMESLLQVSQEKLRQLREAKMIEKKKNE